FSSRRRHTRFSRDWSSDVCSTDLINVIKKPDPARTRNQIRLCILRGPGVIITPVDVCIGVSVLSGSGPPLGERSKIHRGHLSQNELVDGVLRTIALLMLRNPVRTLGPEMEDRNLSVRVGDEPVLIGDLINYSDEVVKPLALGVLGNEPDKEVRV